MVSPVLADRGSPVGRVQVEEIGRARIRRGFEPVADAEFDTTTKDDRDAGYRCPHPVRAHAETALVDGLRKAASPVESDRILDAAANQIEQVDVVTRAVVAVPDAVEIAAIPCPLALPYLPIAVRGVFRFLHHGAKQTDQRCKAVGDDKPPRIPVVGGIDAHRRRTRERFMEGLDSVRQVAAYCRCKLPLASLVGNRVRERHAAGLAPEALLPAIGCRWRRRWPTVLATMLPVCFRMSRSRRFRRPESTPT